LEGLGSWEIWESWERSGELENWESREGWRIEELGKL
jgi:hypothetical protein